MDLVHIGDILEQYIQTVCFQLSFGRVAIDPIETLQPLILTDLLTIKSDKTVSDRFNFFSLNFKPVIFTIDSNPIS